MDKNRGADAGGARGLDVAFLVADQDRVAEAQVKRARGIEDHAGLGLAP